MSSLAEKGGGAFRGIKRLLCENLLRPIDQTLAAAQAEVPFGNYYNEPFSAPLRRPSIGARPSRSESEPSVRCLPRSADLLAGDEKCMDS